MAVVTAPGRGYILTIQAAGATTGAGDVACPSPMTENHTFTITGSSGVGAGAIQLESSDDPTYTGTWIAEGTPITVTASSKVIGTITGKRVAVRARISTTVTGGTCSVTYQGR